MLSRRRRRFGISPLGRPQNADVRVDLPMAEARSRKNELIAGAFLLAIIALGAAIVGVLGKGGGMLASTKAVEVEFSLSQGVRGLMNGSPVQAGGMEVGYVSALRVDKPLEPSSASAVVVVTLRVSTELDLRDDAQVFLAANPLGAGGTVDIRDLGQGKPLASRLRAAGSSAPVIDDAIVGLGLGPKERENVRVVLAEAAEIARIVRAGGPEAVDALKNLKALTARDGDLATFLRTLSAEMGENGDLKATLANLRKASQRAADGSDEAFNKLAALLDKLDKTAVSAHLALTKLDEGSGPLMTKLRGSADRIEAILAENQPDIRKSVQTVERITDAAEKGVTKTFRDVDELAVSLKASTAKLKTAVDDLSKLSEVGREVAVLNRTRLDDTLTDLRSAAAAFKLATDEIRRAPWKLLKNLDDRELDSRNLLDAARFFNEGAGRVDDSVKRLTALMDAAGAGRLDETVMRRMLEELRSGLGDLEKAEKVLFRKLSPR